MVAWNLSRRCGDFKSSVQESAEGHTEVDQAVRIYLFLLCLLPPPAFSRPAATTQMSVQ
jgi:hypothetical protein